MALSASLSITAKTETSITVKWSASATITKVKYSYKLPSDASYGHETTKTVSAKTGSFTVSGLSVNKTYSILVDLSNSSSGWVDSIETSTYNWPYATINNFNLKDNTTVTIVNPLNRECLLNIYAQGTSVERWQGAYTDKIESYAIEDMLELIPNSMTGSWYCTVTYNGNTTTSATKTYSATGYNPTITSVTYQDSNATAQAIIQAPTTILQNISTPAFTISGTGQYNATIASARVTILGVQATGTASGGTATVSCAEINSASDVTAQITVTDSRGNTATTTKTVTMLGYENPSALITLNRQNNYYSETDLTVDGSVLSIGSNTETITAKYREKNTSTWYNWDGRSTLTDNTLYTQSLDNTKIWDVQIAVKDSFNVTTTYNRTVGIGLPILFIDREKRSIGMNSFPTADAQFVVNDIDLLGELFYKPGDTFTLTGYTPIPGFVTLGNKLVRLSLQLPKSLANITTITCTACTGGVRTTAGGYLNNGSDSSNWLNESNVTVTPYKAGDKLIRLEISTSGTYSNVTNNTPVILACNPVTLSFS